jgi:hypothetical protein
LSLWEPPNPKAARRSKVTVVALIVGSLAGAMLALICAALFVAEFALVARGCGSVDPTDPDNYSVVTVVNDTVHTVTVDDCRGAYCNYPDVRRLRPGDQTRVDGACGVTGADMTSWRVRAIGIAPIRYIAVDTPRKHDGVVYLVSRASLRRDVPTPVGDRYV